MTVHEEVVDLVGVVRLLDEHDEFLPSATRSFHSIFVTSSVVVGLEFVSPDFRLTVDEDLLPLSVQRSPNLCVFRVLSLNFVTLRVTCVTANNGFPSSIGTHCRRRQTGRQAFSFRAIGSSSAHIGERLTDGDVVVVEVIKEPLLARGLLGELDISLCDEVVVGLLTCGGVLVRRTQLLSGSARGC